MCGIFVSAWNGERSSLSNSQVEPKDASDIGFLSLRQSLREANSHRGPDYQKSYCLDIFERTTEIRSEGISKCPRLYVELYASELRLRGNLSIQQPHIKDGNILCWNGEIFNGLEVDVHENDGVKLMQKLCSLEHPEEIRDLFSSFEGPYAFAYYHAATQRLYYARDPLGRRSLLVHKPKAPLPCIMLSSVSTDPQLQFEEVSTDFIYYLDLQLLCNSQIMEADYEKAMVKVDRRSSRTDNIFQYATPCRVNESMPPITLPPLRSLSLIPDYLTSVVDNFISALEQSVWFHVRNIPQIFDMTAQARVSILFSGGIDSTVLTYLAHKHIPADQPIDLLNVAFENPRKISVQTVGNIGRVPGRKKKEQVHLLTQQFPSVPDRVTGLQEVEELRRLCPDRIWNFVEINVPYEESQDARRTVEALMNPSRTVMDLSLALALYFASRGCGQIREVANSIAKPYTSPARVVLSGLGSDELLGGYGRHRTAYINGGWRSVIDELQLEIDRIPQRNLGRDDRVISSHGKETRHPFLSLDVVNFLAQLPVHYKLDPRAETGVGDKMLLRLMARKLGLVEASSRKKRAMQFGSHSARMNGEKRGDINLE